MQSLNDLPVADLIQRCNLGESEAWRALITRFERLVHSVSRRYGMSEVDADDVFQSVSEKVFRRLGQMKDPRKLPAWLITVTRRECGRLRAASWRTAACPERISSDEPVEYQPMRWEQEHLVREALGRLEPSERQLMTSLFLDSTSPSYKDIAARLGRAAGSIGPIRGRCFQKLERILIGMGISAYFNPDDTPRPVREHARPTRRASELSRPKPKRRRTRHFAAVPCEPNCPI